MKKLIFALLTCIVFFGCKSKKDKVADIIKDEMFKTLYDFESYEPIETKIDSAFYSIYTDSAILAQAYIAKLFLDDINESLEEEEKAHRSMEIWSDSNTSMGQNKYNEARDKCEESLNNAKLYLSIVKTKMDTIRILSSNFNTEFCGWKATHKFRCKTKGGNFDIGNYLYVFDEKVNEITYTEDLEDKKNERLKSLINEALDTEKQ